MFDHRRVIGGVLAIAVGLLGLGLLVVYLLLRPERFTVFLQSRAQAAGLDLELAYPAIPTLLPHPAIGLQGLTLSVPGASQPILVADHGEVELPWSALFRRNAGIAWLQLDAPRVDLEALQDWIRNLPPGTFARAPSLPRINAGISIFHGSLVGHGQQPWLDELNINAGALYPGRNFHLDMAGTLADGQAFSLGLDTLPSADPHRIGLQQLKLQLAYTHSLQAQLQGRLDWLGGTDLSMHLAGQVRRAGQAEANLQIQLEPSLADRPLQFALHYDGQDAQADLHLPPDQFLQWWSLLKTNTLTPSLSVPDWQGHLRADQLDIGEAHLEGVRIDASPASSRPPPAAAPVGQPL